MGAQGLPNPQDGFRKTQALPGDRGQQLGVSSKEGRQLPPTKPIDTVAPVPTPDPDPDVLVQSLVGSSLEAEPSEHLDNNGVGMQMAATEQWRDGVIGQEFTQDDEDVRATPIILLCRDYLWTPPFSRQSLSNNFLI